jgi:hypothetical protein
LNAKILKNTRARERLLSRSRIFIQQKSFKTIYNFIFSECETNKKILSLSSQNKADTTEREREREGGREGGGEGKRHKQTQRQTNRPSNYVSMNEVRRHVVMLSLFKQTLQMWLINVVLFPRLSIPLFIIDLRILSFSNISCVT